jgi:hypothetical protein
LVFTSFCFQSSPLDVGLLGLVSVCRGSALLGPACLVRGGLLSSIGGFPPRPCVMRLRGSVLRIPGTLSSISSQASGAPAPGGAPNPSDPRMSHRRPTVVGVLPAVSTATDVIVVRIPVGIANTRHNPPSHNVVPKRLCLLAGSTS